MEKSKENFRLDESCEPEANIQKPAASSPSSVRPLSPSPEVQPLSNLCQIPPPGCDDPITPALTNFHLSSALAPSIDNISSQLHGSQSSLVTNPDSVPAHSPSLSLPSPVSPHVPLLSSDSPILEKANPPSSLPFSPSLSISPASLLQPSSPLQEFPSVVPPISTTVPSDTLSQSTFLSHESLIGKCDDFTTCSTPVPALPSEPQAPQTELSLPKWENPPLVCENHKSSSTSSLDSTLLPTAPPPHASSLVKESPPPGWENSKSPSPQSLQTELSLPEGESPPLVCEKHKSSSTSSLDSTLLPTASPPHVSSPVKESPPPGWENSKSPSILLHSQPHETPRHELPPSCSPIQDSPPPGWENSKPKDIPPPVASMPQPLPPNPQAHAYSIPDAEMGQLVCGCCHELISYPRSSSLVQCPCCQTVNYVLEEHQVGNVKCEKCSVLLMYPYGASSVRCSCCHFVTTIGLHNKRPPLSIQQGRHVEPQNCA